jgi:hypothetical protein
VAELGWSLGHRPTRGETDSPEVMTLREFAKEAALVRGTRGQLVLTPAGRRALADPAVLWERVVRTLAAGEDFAFAIRELVLARLLGGPSERGQIEREILPVLSEAGWAPSDGAELTRDMVSFKLWDAIRAMDLLGMIEVGEWPDRGLSLTELGAAAARAILWHRATAPRQ